VEKEAILKEKIPKEPKSYPIVVSEMEREANEETINKIKKGLQRIQSNKAIKQIRKSKEGKIVTSLDKDDQAINDLGGGTITLPNSQGVLRAEGMQGWGEPHPLASRGRQRRYGPGKLAVL